MQAFISIPKDKIFTSEIVINKSRFLGFAKFISTEAEANEYLHSLHEKYHDARHICYAYRLLNTAKASDDGEPAGTAGKPILNILEKRGLLCVIVAVVRYFGGIKLGAGGLLRAYSNATLQALDTAKLVTWEPAKKLKMKLDYSEYEPFLNKIKNRKIKVLNADFSNGVELEIAAGRDEEVDGASLLEEIIYSFEE